VNIEQTTEIFVESFVVSVVGKGIYKVTDKACDKVFGTRANKFSFRLVVEN
jgi:hypothetical protein